MFIHFHIALVEYFFLQGVFSAMVAWYTNVILGGSIKLRLVVIFHVQ